MKPVPFGYKCAWLAIKEASPSNVISRIPVHDAHPVDWSEGIDAAYAKSAFVSPPLNDWILVVCRQLLDLAEFENADRLMRFLVDLSQRLSTAVQFFGTYRVVGYDAWCSAEYGKVLRGYGHGDGRTIHDFGQRTAEEEELGVQFFNENCTQAKTDENYWKRNDLTYPDENYVMKLAGKWSLNPQSLEETHPEVGPGWLGNLNLD